MTEREAVLFVQKTVDAMVATPAVQAKLAQMKKEGKSDDECIAWVTQAAIATLCK